MNAVDGNTNLACEDARKASTLGSVDAASLINMLCKWLTEITLILLKKTKNQF